MSIWNSCTYRNDISSALPQLDVEELKGKSVLITGASGLIGSTIADLLVGCNLEKQANITIYAAGRSIKKIEDRFSHGLNAGLKPIFYDATCNNLFDFQVDYIIHGASNASPDKYVSEPVDTMLANIMGVHNLLHYAKSIPLTKFVYISSSEVYGILSQEKPLMEDIYGTVDILSPRSSYPMSKQASETLCISYANQYNINVSIVRPGHIYGPTAQHTDKRISSAFAIQAARGETLTMKSAGTQIRSYCHCIDCATAILTVLTRGECKEAYNISNKNSIISIFQMASIIANCANVELQLDLPSHTEVAAFNPMNNSSLNSEKLESLGWNGIFDAQTGFAHTISTLQELCI